MPRYVKKRDRGFDAKIDAERAKLMDYFIKNLEESRQRAIDAVKIWKFVNGVFPLNPICGYSELIGDVVVLVERKQAKSVLKRLYAAGVSFDDAGYCLHGQDGDGRDQVMVSRTAKAVSEGVPECIVDRLVIQWVAPYVGDRKCKIVEQTSTYRSLVCSKE